MTNQPPLPADEPRGPDQSAQTADRESSTWLLTDSTATEALGARLAPLLDAGATIHLSGDLGAGKTTLARGLLRALGVAGRIKSPTFAIVEPYNAPKYPVYHFDFYRFSNPADWDDTGFDEYFDGRAVVLVEWPEHVAGKLPQPDLTIELRVVESGRHASMRAHSERARRWLNALRAADAG